ncbi:hypothetical protein AGMMS49574_21040 [Bacteroidia bacterium]|nr:hypothetical protein AGMMS49574_21040 [Bacteroidia bacterium]GHU56850.1 hypothetical protein FACS189411_08600 [Bacteroidia bacterium]
MKVKTYVLVGAAVLLNMSAASKDVRSEGLSPGDLAPRIESLGNERNFNFQNHSNRYTLLNFWAAYDAESRVRNIRLVNEVERLGVDRIAMCSISMDESHSIFSETVRIDNLSQTTQFHAEAGKSSKLYRQYNLKKGFNNFLIDEAGVIVAKNVTPEDLKQMMSKE